ncbi:MAG TPA: condensation domain-containing protein [Streptosporangiaceae bacterium]
MFEQIRRDRMAVPFAGAAAGTAPLTWGQQAILRDMRDNEDQFTMFGAIPLPAGAAAADAAAWLNALTHRHAALRMRLGSGPGGLPCQEVAGSGETGLDVLTIPDDAGEDGRERFVDHLIATMPRAPFDFRRDWPLRVAVVRHRGACRDLVWALSHLAGDGTANLLLLRELQQAVAGGAAGDPPRPQILDVASSEQEPQLRQLSSRAMRYWRSQLSHIPALTFGEPAHGGAAGPRYRQVGFSSAAAHLAILAIAERTGTDASRATLAVIATAIGRVTGVHPLTVNVMVSNRFRPGLAGVFAPVAQNSVVTIDVAGSSVDEVVAQARGASLTAGMRAYYDPGDLAELTARSDAERGYPARVSCRFNDQRAMVSRPEEDALADLTPERLRQRLAETALAWDRPLPRLHDQVSIIIQNKPGVLSLQAKCDLWCLPSGQAEALLRGIEEVAVAAAFDPAVPAGVLPRDGGHAAAPARS